MIDITRNCPLCLGLVKYYGPNTLATKYAEIPLHLKIQGISPEVSP